MNKQGRKQLNKIAQKIYDLANEIDNLKGELEEIRDEEQDKYNNMPEHLQDLENGRRMYEGIEALEDIICQLDSSISELYDVTNDIDNVTEI